MKPMAKLDKGGDVREVGMLLLNAECLERANGLAD